MSGYVIDDRVLTVKSAHYARVEKFMQQAQQEVPSHVHIPSPAVRELRAKLILEEALETVYAMGVRIEARGGLRHELEISDLVFSADPPGGIVDLVEVVDGCCDIAVVTTGTLVAFGVPDTAVQKLVDDSNLEKFGPGHTIREDGKLVKPPGHQPPDIKGLLERIAVKQRA